MRIEQGGGPSGQPCASTHLETVALTSWLISGGSTHSGQFYLTLPYGGGAILSRWLRAAGFRTLPFLAHTFQFIGDNVLLPACFPVSYRLRTNSASRTIKQTTTAETAYPWTMWLVLGGNLSRIRYCELRIDVRVFIKR